VGGWGVGGSDTDDTVPLQVVDRTVTARQELSTAALGALHNATFGVVSPVLRHFPPQVMPTA
jgi:hypothetical protein